MDGGWIVWLIGSYTMGVSDYSELCVLMWTLCCECWEVRYINDRCVICLKRSIYNRCVKLCTWCELICVSNVYSINTHQVLQNRDCMNCFSWIIWATFVNDMSWIMRLQWSLLCNENGVNDDWWEWYFGNNVYHNVRLMWMILCARRSALCLCSELSCMCDVSCTMQYSLVVGLLRIRCRGLL